MFLHAFRYGAGRADDLGFDPAIRSGDVWDSRGNAPSELRRAIACSEGRELSGFVLEGFIPAQWCQ